MWVASLACSPPPTTLPSGIGKLSPRNAPPRCWYSGAPSTSAAAFEAAIEMATALLAPIAEKSSVPSAARSALSTARWSPAYSPSSRGTACSRALAMDSLAGSSIASYSPVDAPEGAAARPKPPESVSTSASTVGFPRESSTRRSEIELICVIVLLSFDRKRQHARVVLLCRDEDRLALSGLDEDRRAVGDLQRSRSENTGFLVAVVLASH